MTDLDSACSFVVTIPPVLWRVRIVVSVKTRNGKMGGKELSGRSYFLTDDNKPRTGNRSCYYSQKLVATECPAGKAEAASSVSM